MTRHLARFLWTAFAIFCIVAIVMLVTVGVIASDKPPKSGFIVSENNSLYYPTPVEKIHYQRCDSCGRDVPSQMGLFLNIDMAGDDRRSIANRKAMFPYMRGRWFICLRCVMERLGVQPDWQAPAVGVVK
jgi:hypothetical protein